MREAPPRVAGGDELTAKPRRYVIEGVPGSGKSTCFGRAIMAAPGCLAFPEINPTRAESAALADVTELRRSTWYLERATAQLRLAQRAHPGFEVVISDKGPLAVLAFTFAREGPRSPQYSAIECAYRQTVYELCRDERALILVSSVEDSLARRALKRETEKGYPWYDAGFLERLIAFFEDVAPSLHPHADVIATHGTALTGTLSVIGDALGIDLLTPAVGAPAARDDRYYPATGHRISDDAVWEFFSGEGGSDFIGQPVTPLMAYHCRSVQFFERGAIERGRDGACHWDPAKLLGLGGSA
jgi:hypothetical protein